MGEKEDRAPSSVKFACPVCKSVRMVETLVRVEPVQYRLTCEICQHTLSGPRDYDYHQARSGLREAHAKSLDRKHQSIKYDDRGYF